MPHPACERDVETVEPHPWRALVLLILVLLLVAGVLWWGNHS
ncbi:MAG: hypothetical protein Q4Q03_08205 [Bowdeniella nasicola]|nr:hypothetical protein [Bowdeniella nasicola]